jgi:hypothetical protein
MIRTAFIGLLALLIAGCASAPPVSSASPRQPAAGDEVHRGLLTNQKSSPDSGQGSQGGDRGGAGGV